MMPVVTHTNRTLHCSCWFSTFIDWQPHPYEVDTKQDQLASKTWAYAIKIYMFFVFKTSSHQNRLELCGVYVALSVVKVKA